MKSSKTILAIVLCTIAATLVVIGLFKYSERNIHQDNNFTRRFLPYAVKQVMDENLHYNSFYFAGAASNKIYVANYANPASIQVLDTNLIVIEKGNIQLLQADTITFRSIQIKVKAPHFFVLDGTVPCIFRGNTSNWQGTRINTTQPFSAVTIIDSTKIGFRTRGNTTGENILGTLKLNEHTTATFSETLLQKQLDGVFDTDGTLQYSPQLKQLIYTYSYRNQFLVTNQNLQLLYRGKTIDTTATAKLQVKYLKSKNVTKFSAPPTVVNARTVVSGNLLFVQSVLRGRFENDAQWKNSSVIDVYNITDNTYRFSFYIPDISGKKMSGFTANDTHFFALVNTQLVAYKIGKIFYENAGQSITQGSLKIP